MAHPGTSVSVPGTETDPEFEAVQAPAWDADLLLRIVFPQALHPSGRAGLNAALTESWWQSRAGEIDDLGVTVRTTREGAVVSTEPGAVADTAIVVLPTFPTLLQRAFAESARENFEAWIREEVLDPISQQHQAGGATATWRYDLMLVRQGAVKQSRRRLFVWPDPIDELSATELLGVPHVPTMPDQPDLDGLPPVAAAVAAEVWSQIEQADATYRLTMRHRALDLVAILRRGTDQDLARLVTPETGVALRAFSKRIRREAVAAGWEMTGYADALLWPLRLDGSADLPTDFVAEAGIEVLRRAVTVALPPAPDLSAWRDRLHELSSLRAEWEAR